MNQKEIGELRRRMNLDKNAIAALRGCYVSTKGEIISMFHQPLDTMPQAESEKYLAMFRKILGGAQGKNLLELEFSPEQVADGAEHQLLSGMRNTACKVEEGVQAFFQKIIDSLAMESNYLILLAHDAYDIPYHAADGAAIEDASDNVFDYIVCAVCPVKLSKPALSYYAADNEFHERELDWVVSAPELGFMFPAYEDGGANIYKALYYTRDASETHEDFIDGIFNLRAPAPAGMQREVFQMVLEDALGEELDMEVLQTVHEELRERIEETKKDKEAEQPVISRTEVTGLLKQCGVSQERVAAFEQKYDEEIGEAIDLKARVITDERVFEVKTPDVVIKVNPERSDLVETRVIDGCKYIMIRANDGVEVNGVNICITPDAE